MAERAAEDAARAAAALEADRRLTALLAARDSQFSSAGAAHRA